jgi:hypothetical protein
MKKKAIKIIPIEFHLFNMESYINIFALLIETLYYYIKSKFRDNNKKRITIQTKYVIIKQLLQIIY